METEADDSDAYLGSPGATPMHPSLCDTGEEKKDAEHESGSDVTEAAEHKSQSGSDITEEGDGSPEYECVDESSSQSDRSAMQGKGGEQPPLEAQPYIEVRKGLASPPRRSILKKKRPLDNGETASKPPGCCKTPLKPERPRGLACRPRQSKAPNGSTALRRAGVEIPPRAHVARELSVPRQQWPQHQQFRLRAMNMGLAGDRADEVAEFMHSCAGAHANHAHRWDGPDRRRTQRVDPAAGKGFGHQTGLRDPEREAARRRDHVRRWGAPARRQTHRVDSVAQRSVDHRTELRDSGHRYHRRGAPFRRRIVVRKNADHRTGPRDSERPARRRYIRPLADHAARKSDLDAPVRRREQRRVDPAAGKSVGHQTGPRDPEREPVREEGEVLDEPLEEGEILDGASRIAVATTGGDDGGGGGSAAGTTSGALPSSDAASGGDLRVQEPEPTPESGTTTRLSPWMAFPFQMLFDFSTMKRRILRGLWSILPIRTTKSASAKAEEGPCEASKAAAGSQERPAAGSMDSSAEGLSEARQEASALSSQLDGREDFRNLELKAPFYEGRVLLAVGFKPGTIEEDVKKFFDKMTGLESVTQLPSCGKDKKFVAVYETRDWAIYAEEGFKDEGNRPFFAEKVRVCRVPDTDGCKPKPAKGEYCRRPIRAKIEGRRGERTKIMYPPRRTKDGYRPERKENCPYKLRSNRLLARMGPAATCKTCLVLDAETAKTSEALIEQRDPQDIHVPNPDKATHEQLKRRNICTPHLCTAGHFIKNCKKRHKINELGLIFLDFCGTLNGKKYESTPEEDIKSLFKEGLISKEGCILAVTVNLRRYEKKQDVLSELIAVTALENDLASVPYRAPNAYSRPRHHLRTQFFFISARERWEGFRERLEANGFLLTKSRRRKRSPDVNRTVNSKRQKPTPMLKSPSVQRSSDVGQKFNRTANSKRQEPTPMLKSPSVQRSSDVGQQFNRAANSKRQKPTPMLKSPSCYRFPPNRVGSLESMLSERRPDGTGRFDEDDQVIHFGMSLNRASDSKAFAVLFF